MLLIVLADILLSVSPSDMKDFTDAEQIKAHFIEEGGEAAKRFADSVWNDSK